MIKGSLNRYGQLYSHQCTESDASVCCLGMKCDAGDALRVMIKQNSPHLSRFVFI